MKPRFTDVARLKKRAKREANSIFAIVRRTWVQKYKLPATHELWKKQPFAVHLLEFFEDKYVQKMELQAQLSDAGLDPERRADILSSLSMLDKLLEETVDDELQLTGDVVMDALEVSLDRGHDFDMDISVEDARAYLKEQGIES